MFCFDGIGSFMDVDFLFEVNVCYRWNIDFGFSDVGGYDGDWKKDGWGGCLR